MSTPVKVHMYIVLTMSWPVFWVVLVASKGFVTPTKVLELPVSIRSVTRQRR